MIEVVNRGLGAFEPLGREADFTPPGDLRPEQAEAIRFVLASRDRAVAISGAAGTGKTATLRELRSALARAGHDVCAVAPTMSAVEELQKVGFAETVTLARLLTDPNLQNAMRGRVIILDEAGMVSARQMAEFLQLAEACSARVVFSGDTRQIQSVEAGDALRILEKESRLKSVALTQVQRQSKKDYREAIEELRRHPGRGLVKLEAIGAVKEVPIARRAYAVAEAFKPGALVVCATHDEIDRVTYAIRSQRKSFGELTGGRSLTRLVSLQWTAAQKADFKNYRSGVVLTFHRAVKGIAKGESCEVIQADVHGAVVRVSEGSVRTITTKQTKSFDVMVAKPIEVSAGDRLLLTANRRLPGLRLTNGEIVTVAGVDARGGIALQDGRTIPADYRHFAHGYAVTAHRSQGKTVDNVIISADGMQQELFYVAASRGRHSLTVITSDKERLRQTVGQSMARKSATDLTREVLPCRPRGLARARELVRRAAEFAASIPFRVVQSLSELRKERRREHSRGR